MTDPFSITQDVYVLGAGFSVPFGLPDGNGLFRSFYDGLKGESRDRISEELSIRNYDVTNSNFYYESFLSDIDSDIGFCKALNTGSKSYIAERQDYLERRRQFIRAELTRILRHKESKFRRAQPIQFPHVEHLLSHVVETKGTVLSFNYDTCLEFLAKQANYNIWYGGKDITKSPRIKIHKLHGSLNWYKANIINRPGINLVGVDDIFIDKELKFIPEVMDACAEESNSNPLIYPSIFKSLNGVSQFIKNSWAEVLVTVTYSKNIHFLGYSMPEGDRLSHFLFRHTSNSHVDRKIFVYDIAFKNQNSTKGNQIKENYHRVFGDQEIQFIATDLKMGIQFRG